MDDKCNIHVNSSNLIKMTNMIEISHIGLIKCDYIAFFDDVTMLNLKKKIR